MTSQRFTIVSFHAHPDDEALFTGGSLAKAASEGHRVVIVVATLGERGLVDPTLIGATPLSVRRWHELRESATHLGCARLECLGYADSGGGGSTDSFASADVDDAARRLADILIDERADVVTTYDAAGGYGHPDHVQVHRVGYRAAELAGTPVVLEATVDRSKLCAAVRWLRRIRWLVPGLDLPDFEKLFTGPQDLTHRIDVRDHVEAKRRAMAAHVTQATAPRSSGGSRDLRTFAFFLKLPRPVFRRALGTEWFVERGRTPTNPPSTDLFESLGLASRAN
jgi:LmbE family N-acetylglucosaminyl deacetylase